MKPRFSSINQLLKCATLHLLLLFTSISDGKAKSRHVYDHLPCTSGLFIRYTLGNATLFLIIYMFLTWDKGNFSRLLREKEQSRCSKSRLRIAFLWRLPFQFIWEPSSRC